MYRGEFSNKKRRLHGARQLAVLISMALLMVGLVGGSLAYLFMSTESVDNTFTPANVSTDVIETNTEDGLKENVKIQNTGNISAYIRAAVIVNWQTEGGIVYGEAPVAGTDYTISYGSNWTKSGDFWYYNSEVAPGAQTGNLITSCAPTDGGKLRTDDQGTEYYLTVTILGSGIQAKGMGAETALNAWTAAKG